MGAREVLRVADSSLERETVRFSRSFRPVLRTVNWMGVRLSAMRFS